MTDENNPARPLNHKTRRKLRALARKTHRQDTKILRRKKKRKIETP